jgi:hypothetical protein
VFVTCLRAIFLRSVAIEPVAIKPPGKTICADSADKSGI